MVYIVLLLITMVCFASGAITKAPCKLSACAGTNLILDWDYDNKEYLSVAVWYKDGKQIGTLRKTSATGTVTSGFSDKVKYVDKGTIKLIDISLEDEGNYKFVVSYTIPSGLPDSTSVVTLTVKDPPEVPTISISETGKRVCYTPYPGTPPAEVYEVYPEAGNVVEESASAKVPSGCCLRGESVTCMKENTDRNTTYCHYFDPALKCYVCGGCKVPSNLSACSGSCKIVKASNGKIDRGCSDMKMDDNCSKWTGGGTCYCEKNTTCYCNKDKCNRSTNLQVTMTTAVTIMTFILRKHL